LTGGQRGEEVKGLGGGIGDIVGRRKKGQGFGGSGLFSSGGRRTERGRHQGSRKCWGKLPARLLKEGVDCEQYKGSPPGGTDIRLFRRGQYSFKRGQAQEQRRF